MKPEEKWKIDRVYSSRFSPEILFEAWISPEMAVPPVVKIEVEPETGGCLVLHARAGQDMFVMKGKFIEFIKNRVLVYSWSWEGSNEVSTVSVKFLREKERTVIHLEHRGFLTRNSMLQHAGGWDDYTAKLEIALEKKGN